MEKKIRGHKRRWKLIDRWIERNKVLDLERLKVQKIEYAKVWVHPWSGITVTNSRIPELRGETKLRVIEGLLEIYFSWKKQLDETGEPYFLKIWLIEPNYSDSEVVCAIDDQIEIYESSHFKPEKKRDFKPEEFGRISGKLKELEWNYHHNELHFPGDKEGPDIDEGLWRNQLMKRSYRVNKFSNTEDENLKVYSFYQCTAWIGGEK